MHLPATFRKLVAEREGKDYRAITRIVEQPLALPGPGQLLMRVLHAGVNASDINITSGAYGGLRFPLDLGVEAVGEVAAVGAGVTGFAPGDAVACLRPGAYGEYLLLDARHAIALPAAVPEALPLVASAMTAAVGLAHVGEMRAGETVLVTGAAGGTGQFAVQLAKLAGSTVIAVCGGDDKAALLRELGADRVINYRREALGPTLAAEYPRGLDLVYECVGGSTFDTCVEHLAPRGRLLVVGYISEYASGPQPVLAPRIYAKLLWKSASVRGFVASHFGAQMRAETRRMVELWQQGRLVSRIDPAAFTGLESIPAALDRLYSGASIGKVIVSLAAPRE